MGRLGQILVSAGVLRADQLEVALAEQRRRGGKLGEVLVRLALVTEDQITAAVASQLHLATVSLERLPAPSVLARVPGALAHALGVLPIEYRAEERTLVVATAEALRGERLERLREHARSWILPKLAPDGALRHALIQAYGAPLGPPTQASVAGAPRPSSRGTPTHPEVRALVALLRAKGLISADEVQSVFEDGAA